jgi:hypothetical protein
MEKILRFSACPFGAQERKAQGIAKFVGHRFQIMVECTEPMLTGRCQPR